MAAGGNVSDISAHLPIDPEAIKAGQEVKVSFCGGPFVFGAISAVLRAGPVLRESDGTETLIPMEDIEDRETLVYLASAISERRAR